MAYRASALVELARFRARGQRPDGGVVIVGENAAAAWAARNRFFFVPLQEIGDDLGALSGLVVVVNHPSPNNHREKLERMALNCVLVVVYDTQRRTQELLAA